LPLILENRYKISYKIIKKVIFQKKILENKKGS